MECNYSEKLIELQQRIGYEFSSQKLIQVAVTHSSYVKGDNLAFDHNERLEFLGDAVLELCVSEYLFKTYPEVDEGAMTRIRAIAVNEQSLYRTALEFKVGEALLLSVGEERTGGREKPSILSDAMEAIIGAVYIDGGYDAARKLVLGFASKRIEQAFSQGINKDYNTVLQEFVQKNHLGEIKYMITGQRGPDHKKIFDMSITVAGIVMGSGTGMSKQEAGQAAAHEALKLYGIDDDSTPVDSPKNDGKDGFVD